MHFLYRHKKTGNLYRKLCDATDATNVSDGLSMVVYRTANFECPAKYYVRQIYEFNEKFELVQGEICQN